MIRSVLSKGGPIAAPQPPKDEEAKGVEAGGIEDDGVSAKTHELSMEDTDVSFLLLFISSTFVHFSHKNQSHCITQTKLMKPDSEVLSLKPSGITINGIIPSPTYCRLSDLPTGLLDYVNNLPDSIRKSLVFRQMFESMIADNTSQDEPDAPPIRVINEIDDEPTPPWEFYYSNKLWYHEDVPGPDYNKLVGCDCAGECDPTSSTCDCLRRQKKLWPDGENSGVGFSYDEDGLLKNWDETIVECNDLCRCSNKCRNRVSV